MPLVTIPLRLFGKSLKEYNFSVFTLPDLMYNIILNHSLDLNICNI